MPLLTVEHLTVTYGRDDYAVTPLDDFHMRVEAGTLAVLLGPSGCGKTTLLSCLSGIQRPTKGSIRFGDVDVTALDTAGLGRYRRDTVGIVFQAFNLVPSLDAAENVMVPLRSNGVPRREARTRARQAARGGRSRRSRASPSGRTLGRAAATRRDRAGARAEPPVDRGRRADGQPRSRAGRGRAAHPP